MDLDGEAECDESGWSVSLSDDGNVLAIGAPYNGGNGAYSGHVRVYAWDPTSANYIQRGDDINGEAESDSSGISVSLSDDGNVLAIGAPYNDGNGADFGHVRVYAWDTTSANYIQRGDDINGEAECDESGWSVSLSYDGNVLAIGAQFNGENGAYSGHVRVYAWDTTSANYIQRGDDINGEAESDQSGISVSLSDDGNVLAIGARFNDGNGANSGHVRVYAWDTTSANYIQRGDDINGKAAGDRSGWSVSLSDDGNVLAIGARQNDGNGANSGHVRVYAWDPTSAKYIQRGMDLDGEAAGDWSGYSVSLSYDGNVLAIGALYNDGNGADSGHVRVYAWNTTSAKYIQRGMDINGEAAGDQSGISVSLSDDGNVLAIGASENDGNGANSGHVRVYKWG
jgi:ribose 5-phosphate isomerase RpiB